MKFINMSGKRLFSAQVMELERQDALICTPNEDVLTMIDCPMDMTDEHYEMKAKKLIEIFDLKQGDMVHINGIDLNLISYMKSIAPHVTYVYSKIEKNHQDFGVNKFMGFKKLYNLS